MAHIGGPLGHSFVSVGINHGLRPEADSELDLAEQVAWSYKIPFERVKVHLEPGGNLQARARDVRYGALTLAKERYGADVIVTAHSFDDKAEGVLIRLLRMSGVGSLGIMSELENGRFKPLLQVTREQITRYVGSLGLPFANDPSNDNEKYDRVWIRKQILPLLETRSPRIREKLVRLADEATELKGSIDATRMETQEETDCEGGSLGLQQMRNPAGRL